MVDPARPHVPARIAEKDRVGTGFGAERLRVDPVQRTVVGDRIASGGVDQQHPRRRPARQQRGGIVADPSARSKVARDSSGGCGT